MMGQDSKTSARVEPVDLEGIRLDVAYLRRRLRDQEHELEQTEKKLRDEERKARIARRGRLTSIELDALDRLSNERGVDASALSAAVSELRDVVLGVHDRRVLEGIRDGTAGEERDLIERLLTMTEERPTR